MATFAYHFMLFGLHGVVSKKTSDNQVVNGAFAKAKNQGNGPMVDRIMQSGELIIGTISGPDTYFDYQGRGMGLQYALAEDFANTLGVGVRVELAKDSLQLVKLLKSGEIDVIAYPLSTAFCKKMASLMQAQLIAKQRKVGLY